MKICLFTSGIIVKWALVLKYAVMMQAGPAKAIQPSIPQGVVRFRENKWYWDKAEKKIERRGGAISRLWHWTGQKNVVFFFSLDKPENVKLVVNDSVVCKGDVISITCSADGKPAVHTYQLFENEIPVNNGNSSAGVWIRKDLKGGDLSYSCVANNTVGTTEKTVNVTVKGTVCEVVVI